MKKRLLMTLCGVLSGFALAFADDVNYSGTVVSKSGEPIMGATVTVTGTTVSTITDMDGKFSLVVPDGYSTVTVTYSGMKKQTVSVQREPVVLYASAEQAEQARIAAFKSVNVKKDYKRNAFNFELSVGGSTGNWADALDYLSNGDNELYAGLNLGWHHGFSKYIAWEVFNIGAMVPVDYFDIDFLNAYVTTGVKFTTPRWKKLSLSYSFNIGADYDNWSEEVNLMMSHKISLNLGKWAYLAFKYNVVNLKDDAKESYAYELSNAYYYGSYNYYGDYPEKIETASFALGFNF